MGIAGRTQCHIYNNLYLGFGILPLLSTVLADSLRKDPCALHRINLQTSGGGESRGFTSFILSF